MSEKRTAPKRTARITLEGLDGYGEDWWFEARTTMRAGEFLEHQAEIAGAEGGVLPPEDMAAFVVNRLAGWNFVDDEGNELPADLSGLKQIEIGLMAQLYGKIWESIRSVPLVSSANSPATPPPA